MNARFSDLLVVLLGCSVVGTCGAAGCAIYIDDRDVLQFGDVKLGATKKELPASFEKSKECLEDSTRDYYDCEYMSPDGVFYLVEGNRITRKEIRDLKLYNRKLIADVRFDDMTHQVISKLRRLPPKFPTWSLGFGPQDGFTLGTDNCLKSSAGRRWSYSISFDRNGRISKVRASELW